MLAIPVLSILAIATTGILTWHLERDASAWVDHTIRVRKRILECEAALLDAQNSMRGFLLTGEPGRLTDHARAVERLESHLAALATATRDKPGQAARVERLRGSVSQMLAILHEQARSPAPRGRPETPPELIHKAGVVRGEAGDHLRALATEEERLLAERTRRRERLHRAMLASDVLAAILGLLGGGVGSLLFTSGVARRVEQVQENAKRFGQGLPLRDLPAGRDEIGRLAGEVEKASRLLAEREAALAGSAAAANDLYDHAPCGYHSLDADGLFIRVNATELEWLGYRREEVEGRLHITDILAPESRAVFEENFPRFKAEGHIEDLEFRLVRRDGTSFDALVNATLLRGPQGEYLTSRSTVVDISARKRAEERIKALNESLGRRHGELLRATAQAQRANRMKSEFLANMSHELRTPLNDTGPGIPPEDIERLFQEFRQLGQVQGVRALGAGLGLALTRKIVEAQGGRVGVRSSLGVGSVFWAVLPLLAPRADEAGPRPVSGGPAVLVVEDDDRDRAWLVETLSEAGYAVETAATAADALERVARVPYVAILLDLLLPDRSGWDVLQGVRESAPNVRTPVIVVSVVADRRAGTAYRLEGFLTKPVRADDLLAALRLAGVPPTSSQPIVVLDDDPRDLRLMETGVRSLGYRAITSDKGAAALEIAEEESPAAVVLDLAMPGMDGFEFLARFRNTAAGRRTPVLVWTALDLTAELRHRLRGHVQTVVAKGDGAARLLSELDLLIRPAPPNAAPGGQGADGNHRSRGSPPRGGRPPRSRARGHPVARPGRSRSHASAQGPPGDAGDPRGRGHRLRHARRRGADAGGRL